MTTGLRRRWMFSVECWSLNVPQSILIFAIRAYRLTISPAQIFLFGPTGGCRFTPTLFAIRDGRGSRARRDHGRRAGGEADLPLPSVGRLRPRSGSEKEIGIRNSEVSNSKFSWTEQESSLFRFARCCSACGLSSRPKMRRRSSSAQYAATNPVATAHGPVRNRDGQRRCYRAAAPAVIFRHEHAGADAGADERHGRATRSPRAAAA